MEVKPTDLLVALQKHKDKSPTPETTGGTVERPSAEKLAPASESEESPPPASVS